MYSFKKRHKDTEKSSRDENMAENYKIVRLSSNLFVDLIEFIVAISMRAFADISKEPLTKGI